MPLDPEMKRVLDSMAGQAGLDVSHMPVDKALEQMRAVKRSPPDPSLPQVTTEDIQIPGPGGEIPARVYRPIGEQPLGVLMNIHGGGWVMGSIEQDDSRCRLLCHEAACVIVSIDYRLAPESRFPAALEDCSEAFAWIEKNARRLSGAASGVAICGSSAGGNLAAAVTLMLRDRGGPIPVFQVLFYPICDGKMTYQSYLQNGEGYFLTRKSMEWFWDLYISKESDRVNPYAAPILASDLRGLPPALVVTAEFDPLRDEGEAFALRLADAGIEVEATRYPGVVHGFMTIAPNLDQSRGAIRQTARLLRAAFSNGAGLKKSPEKFQ